ncbi:hypothetical protein ACWGOQ_0013405 [Aquimarina sp. M1]
MEPFLIKTINKFNTYTITHIPIIDEALETIDQIINSNKTPKYVRERLLKERLLMLKQIAKIKGEFCLSY